MADPLTDLEKLCREHEPHDPRCAAPVGRPCHCTWAARVSRLLAFAQSLVEPLEEALRKIAEPDQMALKEATRGCDPWRIVEQVTGLLNRGRDCARAALAARGESGAQEQQERR